MQFIFLKIFTKAIELICESYNELAQLLLIRKGIINDIQKNKIVAKCKSCSISSIFNGILS